MITLFDTYNTELWHEFEAEIRAHNKAECARINAHQSEREQDFKALHAEWIEMPFWRRWIVHEPQRYWEGGYYSEVGAFILPVTVDDLLAWADRRENAK